MDIPIFKDSVEPIYKQLAQHFRLQIESGRMPPGERLPPTRDLARQLGVGRISVVNAYTQLREEGLIAAHPGRGTFVTGTRPTNQSANPEWPPSDARGLGLREMTRLIKFPSMCS